ncbi:MAG: PQQ-dependent sugar dehydrogenase [Gammaproteobacteria bacterium]|nr:PQQ-dependent sugar dehydrogenase [Gammaproteobacteria bacterium]
MQSEIPHARGVESRAPDTFAAPLRVASRTAAVLPALAAAAVALTAQAQDEAQIAAADAAQRECSPVEQRPPNVPEQEPAFPGQTRACEAESDVDFEVSVLARGLEHPWAVEPLPDGSLLVTERPGRLRIVGADGEVGEPIAGVPQVQTGGQAGLLDVALGPGFESDRMVYLSFSEPRDGGNATSVARGTLSEDRRSLEQVEVIFRAMPAYDGRLHFGSRLAFGPDGMLFVTLGERSDLPMRYQAQDLDSHMGKIIRIGPDGAVPDDNPFAQDPGAQPEIWSLGHRNVQAADFDPQGRLWIVDHGPQGGDELNLITAGENYGWPAVTYGEEYTGEPIPDSVTQAPGYVQPVYYWDPVIAPSGAEFYTGDAFPQWRGSLFIGGLKDTRLVRLTFDGDRVAGEEHLLAERGQRIRDVRQGAAGELYVVTDEPDGELWRIAPQ